MNRELEQLEQAIRELPLRAPGDGLDRRVLRAARRGQTLRLLAGFAAAAGLMLAAGTWAILASRSQPVPAPAAPLVIEQTWSNVSYEGTVYPAEGPPLRAYRLRTQRDTYHEDRATGVTVKTSVPDEQIVLVAPPMF